MVLYGMIFSVIWYMVLYGIIWSILWHNTVPYDLVMHGIVSIGITCMAYCMVLYVTLYVSGLVLYDPAFRLYFPG